PIVGVGMGSDPIQLGLVTSLRRPGGNVTGSAWVTGNEFAGKWVEVLKEAAPRLARLAYLLDSRTARAPSVEAQNMAQSLIRAARATADSAGLSFQVFDVFALNPKQLDRFRDRYTVAGAKDDRRDAFVLATALATDQPAFRALKPEDPLLIELREWSRVEDE